MKKKIVAINFIVILFILGQSCQYNEDIKSDFKMSEDELRQFVEFFINPREEDRSNIHILYSEQFNDSTRLIYVWQNRSDEGFKDFLQLENRKILIYDEYIFDEDSLPNSFFKIHSDQTRVLIMKRNNSIHAYKLNYFINYLEDSTDMIQEVEIDW